MLTNTPYNLSTLTDPEQAMATMESGRHDLVLLDLKMPGRDGLSVLEELMRRFSGLIVIMLTGHGGCRRRCRRLSWAPPISSKTLSANHILCQVLDHYHRLWQQRNSQPLGEQQKFSYPDMVGDSPAISDIKSFIVRAAVSDAPVLVLGESGTGKEPAAQPFIITVCAKTGRFV